jgi:type IV pilus assembly protein PilP
VVERAGATARRALRLGLAPPWLALLLLALLLAAAAGPAAAQQERDAAPQDDRAGEETSVPDIDSILQGEEEILGGGGYTYDPGGRRDPFRSLLETRDVERRGPRPEGVPGLLIDEIVITGLFDTPRGWVAQVRASDQGKSFLLREGDGLYDGEVVSIGRNEVVFKQVVQDPTALKPFQEVVKKLNP